MKKTLILFFTITLMVNAMATTILPKDLNELIDMTDHVVIAKIEHVSMIDEKGNEIHNPNGSTGPGYSNEILLHVTVQVDDSRSITKNEVPAKLIIPLWKMWCYSLGQWQEEKGNTYIFLLKGDDFSRVYPDFIRDLSERSKVMMLFLKKPLINSEESKK